MIVPFNRPLGLSELVMSMAEDQRFLTLFEYTPLFVVTGYPTTDVPCGQVVSIAPIDYAETPSINGRMMFQLSQDSVDMDAPHSWGCYPEYYSPIALGLARTHKEIIILIAPRYSLDYGAATYERYAGHGGSSPISLVPAGVSAWGDASALRGRVRRDVVGIKAGKVYSRDRITAVVETTRRDYAQAFANWEGLV